MCYLAQQKCNNVETLQQLKYKLSNTVRIKLKFRNHFGALEKWVSEVISTLPLCIMSKNQIVLPASSSA